MAQLYLNMKWIQNQQTETLLGTIVSNSVVPAAPNLRRINSARSRSGSLVSNPFNYFDVVMLLEAYFMQLEGTRNKILSVSEYIDDTEDYVKIQLHDQRNELYQVQLTLTIASFSIAMETLIAG
ncbi:putative magnesium transporter MRS2-G [Lycium ferocissimum]|uniref:putative magnesium transporter MRS2-G n=1 Tax=Lycium ferocissimum TaxID=112874 RepID=UPI002816150B|nr:putative magnesium transporter MRS2-G [Lycium ferocissimum]